MASKPLYAYPKIAAIGGVIYSTDGHSLDAYTPATDSWMTKAPAGFGGVLSQVGVANGILYLLGYYILPGSPPWMGAYDPATVTWTSKHAPTFEYAPEWGGVATVSGTMYLVGKTTIAAYDPATDVWTDKGHTPSQGSGFATTPTHGVGFAVAGLNGLVYEVGGATGSRPGPAGRVAIVDAYDPSTNSWTARLPMPTARSDLVLVSVNGKLYAIGGVAGESWSDPPTDVNEAYIP
jgi:hypothetical protein